MKVLFLKTAELELNDAIKYYEEELPGLGNLFQNEVLRAINRIKEFPNAYQQLSKNTRRCLISKFPYGIIYSKRDSQILIVAISHLHRKPDHWRDRL